MREIVIDTREGRYEYDSETDESFYFRKDYLYNEFAPGKPAPGKEPLYSLVLMFSRQGKVETYNPPAAPDPETVSDCKGIACSIGHGLPLPKELKP